MRKTDRRHTSPIVKSANSPLLLVALATWALSLTACINDDMSTTSDQPVHADLAFAISRLHASSSTRMTADRVQTDNAFRGLSRLDVLPFVLTGGASKVAATDNPKSFAVGASSSYNMYERTMSRFFYFSNCSFLSGTNAFLTYAQATPAATVPTALATMMESMPADKQLKAYNGALQATISAAEPPSAIAFELEPICNNTTPSADALSIASYLNGIVGTTVVNDDDITLHWSTIDNGDLAALYAGFIGLDNVEAIPMPGSRANIRAHVGALHTRLGLLQPQLTAGTDARLLCDALYAATAPESMTTANYPATIGLPDGAAVVQWNGTQFVTRTTTTTLADINAIDRFTYPAELWYYGNSLISTSTADDRHAVYENSDNNTWDKVLNKYEYPNGRVSANTRSVAINSAVEYGVARLDIKLKDTDATLKDYRNRDITIGTDGRFPLTGIIVGGQHRVGFNFKPQGEPNDIDTRFIYDPLPLTSSNTRLAMTAGSDVSEMVTTLVLQTYDDDEVTLALEFENNSGSEFRGIDDGIVYPGTRFYLVAKVAPEDASSGLTAETTDRVFTQDYITTLTMKPTNLGKAYNVLPDLLAPRLELGVEIVDQWVQSTPTEVVLP